MKSKGILVYSFIILFLVAPIVLGQETAEKPPTFQFNRDFNLIRPCSDRGFFCGSGFECNLSLFYPDGQIIVNNQVMTDQISFRNFTIVQNLNQRLGVWKGIESCNNGTNAGLKSFDVVITGDGKEFRVFPIQLVIAIIALTLIVLGSFNDRLKLFKTLGSIILMIVGVITLFPGYNFINWTTLLGKGIGFSFIGLGFYFLIEDAFSRDKQGEGFDQKPEFLDE